MGATSETRFQLSVKTPQGSLINIYATDYTEFTEELDALEGLAAKISGVEGLLNGASAAAPIAAPPTQQAAAHITPAPAAAPVATGGPVCEHGEPAKLIPAGVSKASGKPYRAFYCCARGREQQCNFRLTA